MFEQGVNQGQNVRNVINLRSFLGKPTRLIEIWGGREMTSNSFWIKYRYAI